MMPPLSQLHYSTSPANNFYIACFLLYLCFVHHNISCLPARRLFLFLKCLGLQTLQKYENTSGDALIRELERVGELGKMTIVR